ncbi:MAG: alpha/beta fold hydrolase [Bacteroidota bacterium]
MMYLIPFFSLLFCFIISPKETSAQFDNQFYSPSKDYQLPPDLSHKDHFFSIGKEQIHVLELIPEKKAKASILFFMGGGGNASTYTDMLRPLLAQDFNIFIFEGQGYGKSTGQPTHANLLSDAQLVLKEISKKSRAANQRLLIYGASMGSQVATRLTADNPALVQGLILDCPLTSFTDIALAHAPKANRPMIQQFVKSPYSAKESIAKLDQVPLLIIATKEDQVVPFEQPETLYQLAPEPKTLWIYAGEHLTAYKVESKTLVKKIDALIEPTQSSREEKEAFEIEIKVKQLRNSKGQVILELKDKEEEVLQSISAKIVEGTASLLLTEVEAGEYTLTYFHDENENGKFDRNFMGIPKEGYGFSNNAEGKFGPPPLVKRLFKVEVSTYMELYPTYFK